MGKLFGTDGIRGVVNAGLDADLAYKVGLAAAEVLASGKKAGEKPLVTIGKDTRISGDLLKGSLIAGLCTAGADVLVSGSAFFGHPPYDRCHQRFQAAARTAADNAHDARCAAAALWQPGRALKK